MPKQELQGPQHALTIRTFANVNAGIARVRQVVSKLLWTRPRIGCPALRL